MNPPQNWQLGWADLIASADDSDLGPGSTLTIAIPVQSASAVNTVRVIPNWLQPQASSNFVPSFWVGYRIDNEPYDLPSSAHQGTFSASTDSQNGIVNLYQVSENMYSYDGYTQN